MTQECAHQRQFDISRYQSCPGTFLGIFDFAYSTAYCIAKPVSITSGLYCAEVCAQYVSVQGFDIMSRDDLRHHLSQYHNCNGQKFAHRTCCAGCQYHEQMPYKVKATQATHEPLQVVGHSEETLLPAGLPLDLGLNP